MIEQHSSVAQQFLKKGFWLYLFSIIGAPLGYIVKIIVSGELQVDEVGIIYGVMSLMILASSFNDLGMAESLNKFIPEFITEKRYDRVKTILLYAILAQLITGFIIFLFFFFGADFLSIHYFKDSKSMDVIKIFAFYFLANNFFHVQSIFFGAVQNTFLQKSGEFFRVLTVLICTVFLFYFDLGSLKSYSFTWIIGLYLGVLFASCCFYFSYYKKYLKEVSFVFEKDVFKKILKYAFLVFLGAQAGTILSQIDMQMIIYMLGNTDAGYFSNYLSLISIPFMFLGPILGFLFPIFSEMHSKNEIEKIKLIKKVFVKNFVSFSIMFSVFFFVFGEVISIILFGEKFATSGIILQYSILFLTFNFLLQVNFSIMAGIGKVKERIDIILIAIVFNTILNYILIKLIGVAGSSLATGFGWVLIWWLSELKIKEYKVEVDYKYIFKNIISFGIIGVFMYYFLVGFLKGIDNRFYEFLSLGFIFIVYSIFFAILNKKDFIYFLSEIKQSRKIGKTN